MMQVTLVLILISQTCSKMFTSVSLNIHISSLKQCNSEDYPLQISNINIKIVEGKVIVSGTLSTSVELASPLQAVVDVKRDEWGVWIKMPCVDKMGSCTYDDLCTYGIPANTTCPRPFTDNNVPCRCPVPIGTYIIPPSIELLINPHSFSSIYSGKYWAKVLLTYQNTNLTCYEMYFQVKDAESEPTSVNANYNDIEPFVVLIRLASQLQTLIIVYPADDGSLAVEIWISRFRKYMCGVGGYNSVTFVKTTETVQSPLVSAFRGTQPLTR